MPYLNDDFGSALTQEEAVAAGVVGPGAGGGAGLGAGVAAGGTDTESSLMPVEGAAERLQPPPLLP